MVVIDVHSFARLDLRERSWPGLTVSSRWRVWWSSHSPPQLPCTPPHGSLHKPRA